MPARRERMPGHPVRAGGSQGCPLTGSGMRISSRIEAASGLPACAAVARLMWSRPRKEKAPDLSEAFYPLS